VHLVYGFRGVTLTDPRRRALEVLSTVLSGQGGRLFVELRDKKSLAYSLSSYSVEGLDPGYFAVYMGTSPEKVPEALAGIREELRKVRDGRIPEAELERARLNMIGSHEIGLQRHGARAGLLALESAYGLPLEDVHAFSEQVLSVTADDVRAVAEDILRFDRAALGAVGPGVEGLQLPSA
jgi:zinc protease